MYGFPKIALFCRRGALKVLGKSEDLEDVCAEAISQASEEVALAKEMREMSFGETLHFREMTIWRGLER
jgi:hypothetical protein